MAVYYEDRFLRPRRGAVPRRTQRNFQGQHAEPKLAASEPTNSNPEVSGFHPGPGRDHAYKAWNMSCSLCFRRG